MNAIKCDSCDKVSSTEGLIDWFHLEGIGIKFSHEELDWHFCSWDCITEFADKKSPQPQ
jgi:hypothetical protein